MRKLNELNSDEFCDVVCALSPVLHIIVNMEIVQGFLFKNISEELADARKEQKANAILYTKSNDEAKKQKYEEKIREAVIRANKEMASVFARDIVNVLPLLLSKENRAYIFEVFSIIEKISIDEVKLIPAPNLSKKIQSLINDTDFASFLLSAEKSESKE